MKVTQRTLSKSSVTTNKCGTPCDVQFVFHFYSGHLHDCVVPSIKVMTLVESAMFPTLIALPCQGLDQINLGEFNDLSHLLAYKKKKSMVK